MYYLGTYRRFSLNLEEEEKILGKKLTKRTCRQPPRHDRAGLASLQEEDKILKKKKLEKRTCRQPPRRDRAGLAS